MHHHASSCKRKVYYLKLNYYGPPLTGQYSLQAPANQSCPDYNIATMKDVTHLLVVQ